MEKIYEEKSVSQSSRKNNLSIVLSFIVAIFAIVSLIAVGFNQISYAADGDGKLTVKFGKYGNVDAKVYGKIDGKTLYVPMMFSDSDNAETATKPILCIQQGTDASAEANAYTSHGDVYDDLGLIYIMNQSKVINSNAPGIMPSDLKYPSTTYNTAAGIAGQPLDANDKKAIETYGTQLAIWLYMHNKYPASDPRHGKLDQNNAMDLITQDANVYSTRRSEASIFQGKINNYIASVVSKAQNATNYKTVQAVVASESISLVGDTNVYQTDKITVVANPSSDLVNYSVDLSGLDGAYVVDKDGNKKTSLDTFAPSDFFYIRVPADKITDNNKTVKVEIVGEFTNYVGGEYFLADDKQAIVSVTSENFRVWNEASIDFMVTPPTGMTTAQTIYFIGLIVLLCGVGIIYANAKPVEEK